MKRIACLVAAILMLAGIASAQEARATIQGVVKDSQGGLVAGATVVVTNTDTKTIINLKSSAVGRYSVTADRFNFAYLGDRRTESLPENFALLTRDLIQFAPQAALNRGASDLRENTGKLLTYPSKNAFFEEIIWLLWRMQQAVR